MKLYNTKSRSVEEFKPLAEKEVKIYTCGLTVYSQPHIGNWVGYIYWDVLVRLFEELGFDVIRVQNITDVGHLVSDDDSGEDKMEKGARAEGITAWDVAEKYIKIADHEGYDLLKLKHPTKLVRATDSVDKQIDFVKALQDKGFCYDIAGEGIYFDTSKLNDYGALAKLDVQGLQAGARVAVNGKRNITDFALWKFSPTNHKRDMEWESPWGKGFPGWHLECSAIARENLGDQIDIHTGGIDHIPVHHTNEIAQTEALTGKPFSTFWLHNNHLKVDGGKMAKSLGNVYTLQDVLDKGFSVAAFKLLVLSKHYRTEGNFTWKILQSVQNRLSGFLALSALSFQPHENANLLKPDYFTGIKQQFVEHLENDLNTPEAVNLISAVADSVEQNGGLLNVADIEAFNDFVVFVDRLLGLDLGSVTDIADGQKELIKTRSKARESKNWAESDRIRDLLLKQGIVLKDVKDATVWSKG